MCLYMHIVGLEVAIDVVLVRVIRVVLTWLLSHIDWCRGYNT